MKKNYKYLLAALAFVTSCTSAFATKVTPEQALERAIVSNVRKAPSHNAADYKLIYTQDNDVYVFASDKGYLALPSDDSAPAILGYSEAGNLSADQMPPAMRWWLSEYARQIDAAKAYGVKMNTTQRASRNPIEPMVATRWNQDAPFNDMCPLVDGKHCVTGCVATALAQIMNYHQWPAKGVGSHSYTSNGTSISLDFSTITFDWQDMLDRYTGGSENETADNAVAQLMYACGVAVDMQYTTSESSASSFHVAPNMVEHFNYDAGIRYVPRDYYGLMDWENYVYAQLVDYGPVQYSGQSNQGGHSFVCDGYSSDGYFHINWGWGGMSDGYFLLTALDPIQQGIGGSTSGFNYDQDIIACVSKPKSGSTMYVNFLMTSSFDVEEASATLGSRINISGDVYNFSTGKASGSLGIKIENASTGTITYAAGSSFSAIEPLAGFGSYQVNFPQLEEGTYVITPALRTSAGKWQDIPVKISEAQKVNAKVEGNTAYFTDMTAASIKAEDLQVLNDIYLKTSFKLTATLQNTGSGEYYGTIAPALVNSSNEMVALADNVAVDILGGEDFDLEYMGAFSNFGSGSAPAAGAYTLYLVDTSNYEPISDGVAVNVYAEPTDTEISVSGLKVVGDAQKVDAMDAKFTATVACTAGYFGGTLTLAIFPYSTSSVSSIGSITSDAVFVPAGQSATLTMNGAIPSAKDGEQYMAAVFKGSSQVSDLVIFKVGKTGTALETVETENYKYNIYGIDGRVIELNAADTDNLPAGIYIVEQLSSQGTQRIINRVIRR